MRPGRLITGHPTRTMTNDTIEQLRNDPDVNAYLDTPVGQELTRIAHRESTIRVLHEAAHDENPGRVPATNDYLRVLEDTRLVARWERPDTGDDILVRYKAPEGHQVVHADGQTALTHCARVGPMYVVHQINNNGYPTLHTWDEYSGVYYDAILSDPGGL